MTIDSLEEFIQTIEYEFSNSFGMEYRTKEGFCIVTDVGFVRQWFNIYKGVLRRRYMQETIGGFAKERSES